MVVLDFDSVYDTSVLKRQIQRRSRMAEQWLPNTPDNLYQSYPSNSVRKTPIDSVIFEIGVGTFCPDNVPTFSEYLSRETYDRVIVAPHRDRIPKYD